MAGPLSALLEGMPLLRGLADLQEQRGGACLGLWKEGAYSRIPETQGQGHARGGNQASLQMKKMG